jgi:hypothetical protein
VLVWLIFAAVLFVLEPLVLRRRHDAAPANPHRRLRTLQLAHSFLLALSLLTIAGAVAGSHGLLLFQ